MKSQNNLLTQTSRAVDNTRGSKLWCYNHFRKRILTSLLNDLVDLENKGLDEKNCKVVRRSLEYFINASTEVESGGILAGKPLFKEIEQFAIVYKEWNDIHGEDSTKAHQRKLLVRKLRIKRQNITDKCRKLQFEIDNNLDQKILFDSYTAIGELIRLVPSAFKNLSSSYKDYIKRGGLTN